MEEKVPFPEAFQNRGFNIYEAVMVIAKRARKISADQKLEIESNMNTKEPEEETETEEEESPKNEVYLSFEKPTMIALRELEEDNLDVDYRTSSPT